jgi:cell division protein FtsI (penicillin-binding protein 3)
MKARGARADAPGSFRWRAYLLLGLLGACALALIYRAVNLQLVDHGFLAKEGDARFSRVLEIVAHRGTITDRYGEPLAVSTPVDSIWVNPGELAPATDQIPRLAKALGLDRQELARRITSNLDREFLYLARHRQPAEAAQIKVERIPGPSHPRVRGLVGSVKPLSFKVSRQEVIVDLPSLLDHQVLVID